MEFHVSKIIAFSKEQVVSLINRIKYEVGAKSRFLAAIESHLYKSHEVYLSNPLLCIIMLMTFDQGAGIPEKQHLFFDLAFDVLFYKHDATKGGHYRRLFLTQLSIDRFKAAFGSFSAFSYIGKGSSFMRDAAMRFSAQALAYDKIEKEPEDLISDMTKRMCLLIKEGSRYSYIHRSFQEYFTAYFLSQRSFEGWDAVVHQIVLEKTNDTVIAMLRDMNPSKFEQKYLKEKLKSFISVVEKIDHEREPQRFCQTIFYGFALKSKPPHTLSWWSVGDRKSDNNFHYILSLLPRAGVFPLPAEQESWASFLKLKPKSHNPASEREVKEFYFHDFNIEQAKATPFYTKLLQIAMTSKGVLQEIEKDAENKKKLVASSILANLGGLQAIWNDEDESGAYDDDEAN